MKTTYAMEGGSLVVTEDTGDGVRTRSISAGQIAAHRRDADFEAGLQAAAGTAGNLSKRELAALPAP